LDVTFGIGGKVVTDFSGNSSQVRALAIQSDGKIIAAGYAGPSSAGAFALARYDVDGPLDTSFGVGGKVTTFFNSSASASAVSIQSDGQIVVGGSAVVSGGDRFALARYNSDGSLDASFGNAGLVTTQFSDGSTIYPTSISAMGIQPDGKIVAVGTAHASTMTTIDGYFALARYNSDGSLDGAFGRGGTVFTTSSGDSFATAMAIQPDGRIVVGGSGHAWQFLLQRYNGDGSLDTTFGSGGRETTNPFDGDFAGLSALTIQPDGKIVAAGGAGYINSTYFALARYNSDGSGDMTFGYLGTVTTTVVDWSYDWAYAVAIQWDGKIVAAGYGGSSYFALVRYNSDGSLDTNFGPGGKVVTNFGMPGSAYALAIQSDGKIVTGGSTGATGTTQSFALARYNSTPPPVQLTLAPTSVRLGGSFTASFSGTNLDNGTYFDVRFHGPLDAADQIAVNWQQGMSATHFVPTATAPGTWAITGARPHSDINDHNADIVPLSTALTVSPLLVTNLSLSPGNVAIGGSFVATVSGININTQTYFDVLYRGPDGADHVALNWQQGTTAVHSVGDGTATGSWTITGIWAHQNTNDHSTDFAPVSVTLTVTQFGISYQAF
jgi:uncharacterized delta-60 repeat protein